MAGQLWIRDECEYGVGVDAHARRIGYRAILVGRVTPTLLASDNGGRESVGRLISVGDGVDRVALTERTLTVQTGKVCAFAADCVTGKRLSGGCFNDGTLVGGGIGRGVHCVYGGLTVRPPLARGLQIPVWYRERPIRWDPSARSSLDTHDQSRGREDAKMSRYVSCV
jgi:hypothetical protein